MGPCRNCFSESPPELPGSAQAPSIGKSSVENAIKKLIEEGVLVKHGTGRAACYTKSAAE